MYIETIRYAEGRFHLLDLHNKRMAATMYEVYGIAGSQVPVLQDTLHRLHIDVPGGVFKYRIIYDTKIRKIEFEAYTPRIVRSLMTVNAPQNFDYRLKQADRTALTSLTEKKGACDEILIIKNGLITDTSYSNIVFKGSSGIYTPRNPLLNGVMRQHLLINKDIVEYNLTVNDILPGNSLGITEAYLINAMMPPGSTNSIPVDQIVNNPAIL